MFYSQLLLAKKGALGKVWLAAHYDRRLTKAQIANTDIKTLVASVEKPSAALSLRVSAHLLLGLSKIFQRQVMYLFVETNDALVKIRAAFKPGAAAAARRSDIDAPEEGLRGNVDMQLAQHGGVGAGAGALLLAGGGSALPDMEGGAFPDLMGFGAGLEGDGEWSEFFLPGASQGQGGRESASARRGAPQGHQQRGVALDEEVALPEMAGEELEDADADARRAGRTATRSTATRSSVSDVELLRRGGGGAGSVDGGSVPSRRAAGSVDGGSSEADERSSVFSDREDGRAGRGRRGRSSMMPLEAELATGGALGVALAAQGGGGLELNEEERDMAALMEGHGGGGDGYDGYDAGGGYVDMGGDYEEAAAVAAGPAGVDGSVDGAPSSSAAAAGGAKAPKTPGGAAMDEGEGEGGDAFDPAAGAYATTAQQQAAALAAEEARRKAQREAREAERQSRAAARKEKRERALQASSSAAAASSSSSAAASAAGGAAGSSGDAQLVLSGEQIKGWLGNTARITRPALDLTSHEAVAAMAARLRIGPFTSAGRKARAFADGAVAGGAFSADAEAAVVSGPGYASLKRDQLDAAPAVPGLDGLSLAAPDAAVEAAAAALTQGGEAGKRALPAALAALEGRLLACGGGLGPSGGLLGVGLAPCNPRVAALAAAHAHGRSAYPRPTAEELAEAGAAAAAAAAADGGAGARGGSDGEEDAASAAAAEAAGAAGAAAGLDLELEPYGGGSGGGEYEDGGYYEAGDRFGQAAEGALDADGQLALDPSPAPSAGSGRSKLDALGRDSLLAAALRQPFGGDGGEDGRSVGAPGSAPRDDADAASVRGAEAGSVVAATPGGAGAASQATAGSAPASVGPLAGEFVESGKWHQQTKAMLRILAAEMTGPEVKQPAAQPLTGRKRKASELEAAAGAEGAAKVYDLSDVQTGVGGEGDPISFDALAEGADANQAAVSFLQLLQLKTWDIIGVAQEEAYADVRITRTTRFATALEEVSRGLH